MSKTAIETQHDRPALPARQLPWRVLRALVEVRELTTLIFVLLIGTYLSIVSPHFLTVPNLTVVALGMSINAIVAVGMTILLVLGGFDLSVGATLAVAGALAGLYAKSGGPVPVAVAVGLTTGLVVGLINGVCVARVGINPLIQTLGMLSILRGATLLIAGGYGVTTLPSSFNSLGQTVSLGLQTPIWVMLAVVGIGDLLLRRTRLLRQAYYIGGNEKAARLSGINVDRVKIGGYVLSALLASLAGVLLAARFGAASVSAGQGIELAVIAAVVIGGASLSGGEGTILGALLGVLLMELISNGLNLLGVAVYWQPIVIGLVLIVAVALDALSRRLKRIG